LAGFFEEYVGLFSSPVCVGVRVGVRFLVNKFYDSWHSFGNLGTHVFWPSHYPSQPIAFWVRGFGGKKVRIKTKTKKGLF